MSDEEPQKRGPGRPKGVKNGQGRKVKKYPPRQKKRPPQAPKSEAQAAAFKRLGDARRGAPGGPGRPVGSRDARIILSDFGQLTLAQIKAKAEDPKTPIYDQAYLARWVRAQTDERTMMDIENRIHGMPTQPTTIGNPDGSPLGSLTEAYGQIKLVAPGDHGST